MNQNKDKLHFAWWILIGLCITVGLGKGALTGSAGLYLPQVSKALHIGMGNLTIYLSIAAVITLVFLPIGGKMIEKYNPRILLTVAIILQAGAFVAFGFMRSVWGWYVFSFPLAVGGVLITVIAGPVLINRWFKKKNGLALGILGAAGGLIGAVAQPIVGHLITNQGWRFGYIALGLGVIVIAVPVILLLLRKNPQVIGLRPYGARDVNATKTSTVIDESEKGVLITDAKKSSAFYALLIFFFLITSIASFSVHIPTYMINQGYSIAFAGQVMGGYMFGVLLGSLAMGYAIDKIGTKTTAYATMLLGILAVFMMLFLTEYRVVAIFATGLFGFTASNAINTLAPALTTSVFGSRNYSQIYSTASLGLAVASIVALPAYGYVFDLIGSYKPVLSAMIVMMVMNMILVAFAFRGKGRLQKEGKWN